MKRIFPARVSKIVFLVVLMIAVTGNARPRYAYPRYEYPEYSIVPAYRHYSPAQLREVQLALRRQGYYTGVANGFMGYRTDLAISRFQLDHCHPVRPVVDRWLLTSLGILRPVVD